MQNNTMGRKVIGWAVLACVLIGTASTLQARQAKMAAEGGNIPAVIRGTVRSPEGTPLYGILVKGKGVGKNHSTYVFTDEKGSYDFPVLPLGAYQVSVGTARVETVPLTASGANQDFSGVQLGPDFLNQTTGPNWLKAIPGSEAEKTRVAQNCVGCHSTGRLFTNTPASPAGWARIVDRMIFDILQGRPSDWWPRHPDSPVWDHYHAKFSPENLKALTEFLAKNITRETQNVYAAKAMMRPRGEAARAVFTEWELPSGGVGDSWPDKQGIIWYLTSRPDGVGRLDPRTGEFQEWAYPDPATKPGRFHDVWPDERGDLWITAAALNKIIKFDVRTHQFTAWDVTKDIGDYPHTGEFDQSGNFWFTLTFGDDSGVAKVDPRTGKITKFPVPTKWSYSYGLTVDKKDNVWFTEHHANKIGRIEARTGKLREYTVPTPVALPRRIRPDSKGRVWFTASGYPGQISMLDPETGKFSEYDYGIPNGYPYVINVDKSDKVWFNSVEGNLIGKFDPEAQKFVLFLLPVPETYSRETHLDFSTDPIAVVYPLGEHRRPGIGRMYVRP